MRGLPRHCGLILLASLVGPGLPRGGQVEALHGRLASAKGPHTGPMWPGRVARDRLGLRGGISDDDNFPSDSTGRFSSSTADHQSCRMEKVRAGGMGHIMTKA
eukprot:753986-Hanusia_phi.AAC.6